MHLLPLLRWIGGTPVARAIDGVKWAFPVIESIHVLGMTLVFGTVAALDLRMLGAGPRRRDVPGFARELQLWTLIGLGVMLMTGPLLFSTDPVRYGANPAFLFKMQALVAALILHFTFHRKAALSREASAALWGKLAACLSLALLIAVVVAARWIATY